MAITVICSCGNVMAAAVEHAGKRVRCTSCKRAVEVPTGEDDDGPAVAAPPEVAAAAAPRVRDAPATRVSIVDVDISFLNLTAFLVKLVSASFPAAVVAYLLYGLTYAFLSRR